jgi:hypothetical protein
MRHACSASTRQRCRGYSSGPKIDSLTVLSVPLLPKPQVLVEGAERQCPALREFQIGSVVVQSVQVTT